jgi:N-acetyl-anhydromuramyl-L-alanine amidase AmpD
MSVDESGAPWPYDPVEAEDEDDAHPTWSCPEGICACHPTSGDAEKKGHRVVLFDHEAKRMPGARCRILENGKLVNLDAPYADGSGAVTVQLSPTTRALEVEWAPASLPQTPRYPFRKRYHVDVGQSQHDGVARRLHNLGFSSWPTLPENVLAFQQIYSLPPTGRAADVENDLVVYHDDALLPPVPPSSAPAPGAPGGQRHQLVAGQNPAALEAAAPGGGGPGAAPGAQAQGSVTGVQTTRVAIELHMAFSLDPDSFRKLDTPWKDAPYNIAKLLEELYPTKQRMTWRLGGRGSHPVVGAVLKVEGHHASKQPPPTNAQGRTVLDLFVPKGGEPFIRVTVEPAPGQKNDTRKPAGPKLTDEKTSAPFLFRPFTLTLGIDDSGALVTSACDVIPDEPERRLGESPPSYVRMIEVVQRKGKGDNLVLVDWRPDWMAPGSKKINKSRRYDTRDVPINPYDNAHGKEDRLARSPPAVVLHQTGTHNLSFLPGFIGNPSQRMEGGKLVPFNEESIHYVVDLDGFVIKVLDEFYRANHGGGSAWEQRVGVNDFTVGFEILHTDTVPLAPTDNTYKMRPRRFTVEQYEAIIRVLKELREEYPLLRRRIAGHMEVLVTSTTDKADNFTEEQGAPAGITDGTLSRARIGCPGPFFDWQRLEEAGVSLAPGSLPGSAPSDPALAATFAELPKLASVTEIKLKSKSPEAKLVKQLLFDIGYSVIKAPQAYTSRSELPNVRAGISDEYDATAAEAVRAFQTHYFSGRRRAYTVYGKAPADGSAPAVGTLDQKTILAIQQVWYAAMTTKD